MPKPSGGAPTLWSTILGDQSNIVVSDFSGFPLDPQNIDSDLIQQLTLNELRTTFNDIYSNIAENDFENGLEALNYPDGFYDVFVDESKIASKNNITVNTGTDGNIQLSTFTAGFWDLTNASYDGPSISTQDSSPDGIFWKPDGTKFWEIGDEGIYEYNVSTVWELNSASYSDTSISTQDSSPGGIFWKPDGTKFWEIGLSSDMIYERDVSNPWDLSTASYSGTSISTQDDFSTGIFWKPDGTKFWEIGLGSDMIYEWDVSNPWDLSSATYSGTSISTQDSSPDGIFWKPDGTKFWETGSFSSMIYEWDVSNPWDLSSATYSGTSISTQGDSPTGIFWKPDGTKFWEINSSSDMIYEWDIDTTSGTETDGSVISTVNDLGYQATAWTPTADYQLNGQTIDYFELQDGNGNQIAQISESQIGDTIDISTTATSYQMEISLSGDGTDTPQINKYENGLDD